MKTLQAGMVFLLMFFLLAGSAFAQCGRVPLQAALDAMVSDSEVTVTQVDVPSWPNQAEGVYNPKYYYEFKPVGIAPTDGFIFYPGADVDEKAYAVTARAIAQAGFLVALVPMPSCVAMFGIGRADAVIANNPDIDTWTIGGHSFGGVCAGWYITGTYTHNSKINGIVFWASYPAETLAAKPIKAISLWGTKDNLTTEQNINDSKSILPADTYYVAIKGGNHTQFGLYGLTSDDYDYLSVGSQGQIDNPADISRQEQDDLIVSYTVNFLDSLTPDSDNVPAAVEQKTADDGSVWDRVSLHGFVDINNTDIVALTPYQGNLYALTRNDVSGFELWKTDPAQGWQRIHVQGFTDQSDYYGYNQSFWFEPGVFVGWLESKQYNPNMNIWADMIEFNDKLYVAVSTGYQGSALFGSRGALIWRTDGVEWEPVIGGHEPTAQGTLSAISSCANNDGSTTAVLTDSTKAWQSNSLVGCTLEVEAAFTAATHLQTGVTVPAKRVFNIVSNTSSALTVQQNEKANTSEYTVCVESLDGGGDSGRPRNNLAGFATGAAYTISCGDHAPGFGDPWNKSIIDFEILDDVLYASIGLNYEKGARIMKTADGMNWVPDSPYSFDNIHGEDWHDGSTLAECLVADGTTGTPVSSSLTKMIKTSLTGPNGVPDQETLLIGGTGTTGCNGRGARIYRRDGDQVWTPIVDVLVDENNTGTNENAFGYDSGDDFFYSAFQAWSWVEYDANLLVAVVKLEAGGMIFSTPDAAEEDGAWAFSMGGQSADREKDTGYQVPGTAYSSDPDSAFNGFGDVLNTGVYLYNYNDTVYAGTLVTNLSLYYLNPLNGADMWKGTGAGDSLVWTRINGDGFGDSTVLQFQSFTEYATNMYMVASTVNPSDFRGQEPPNYTGAVVYRLAEEACQNDSDCDDGVFCNGVETCSLSVGCVAGSSPCIEGQLCDEDNDQCVECLVNEDCSEGSECVEGVCESIQDDAPAIGAGPFVAAGAWPLLPTGSPENPTYLNKNYYVLWTFSDDFGSCSGDCTHTAEYQVPGAETWTSLSVSSDAAQGFAFVELPITGLQNATTYAFRFAVTDCANQTTQSDEYYFRVATSDAPPVIATGPFVAAGAWPLLPKSLSSAFVFDRNYSVLWTFSDDYASCGGDCTHRARYRKVDAVDWTWIQVGTDPSGKWYALTELPIESMEPGDYMFHFDVLDCAGQRTGAPNVYYFKVADPQ